jgi:hypothetical protein
MIKKIAIAVAVLTLLISSLALAGDNKTTPAEEQAKIQQSMQMMTPMFGQMAKSMMEAGLDILADPQTANKLASFTKNYYDALVKQGFTKEYALKITMSAGIPKLAGMQK